MNALYEDLTDRMAAFDSSSSKQEQEEVLEKLKETHATSAGLKAFCTVRYFCKSDLPTADEANMLFLPQWGCLETIEKCRQACGGHGYSAYVGLSGMYADQAVQCSWEGDVSSAT